MKLENIDNGNEFDFGKTSKDYSKYRDIYPQSLYEKLYSDGIGLKNQKILDLGTGTGVFPREMYKYGAEYTGIDISTEQIEEAKRLAKEKNMQIIFEVCSAENMNFKSGYFDVVSAIQCFLYFNKDIVLPKINDVLTDNGLFVIAWMAWLPFESEIAQKAEELVLKYNPNWKGAGYRKLKPEIPEWSKKYFTVKDIYKYDESIPFNIESCMGRIRACRGVSAALNLEQVKLFDEEHAKMLQTLKIEEFLIPHQILVYIYKKK